MNPTDPTPEVYAAPSEITAEETAPAVATSTEKLSGVFAWIAVGAIAFGGLPYLYPSSST